MCPLLQSPMVEEVDLVHPWDIAVMREPRRNWSCSHGCAALEMHHLMVLLTVSPRKTKLFKSKLVSFFPIHCTTQFPAATLAQLLSWKFSILPGLILKKNILIGKKKKKKAFCSYRTLSAHREVPESRKRTAIFACWDGAGTFEQSVAGISEPPALIDGLSIYHAR